MTLKSCCLKRLFPLLTLFAMNKHTPSQLFRCVVSEVKGLMCCRGAAVRVLSRRPELKPRPRLKVKGWTCSRDSWVTCWIYYSTTTSSASSVGFTEGTTTHRQDPGKLSVNVVRVKHLDSPPSETFQPQRDPL